MQKCTFSVAVLSTLKKINKAEQHISTSSQKKYISQTLKEYVLTYDKFRIRPAKCVWLLFFDVQSVCVTHDQLVMSDLGNFIGYACFVVARKLSTINWHVKKIITSLESILYNRLWNIIFFQ